MKVTPGYEEVKELCKGGDYDLVPISTTLLSDFITPIEAMRIFQGVSTHVFLLESAKADENWGR